MGEVPFHVTAMKIAVAKSGPMGQQVFKRNRTFRRIGFIEGTTGGPQNAHLRELRGIASNRFGQCDPAFINQHESRDGSDWLRHRGNSEYGVQLDRQIGFDIPPTHADCLGFSIAPDKSRRPGELTGV
jgi:hypothetical protein